MRGSSPPFRAGLRWRGALGWRGAFGLGLAAINRGATGVLGVLAIGHLLITFYLHIADSGRSERCLPMIWPIRDALPMVTLLRVAICCTPRSDTVVILHGLGRTNRPMQPMARALVSAGYRMLCATYPSHRLDIAALAQQLAIVLPQTGRVRFIVHSLGGVLAVRLAAKLPSARRGRVVQLGAPNHGSTLAWPSACRP